MTTQPPYESFDSSDSPGMPANQMPSMPPTPGGPPEAAVPASQKNSKIGLVALIIGVAAFIFSVIPGALIIGWILLPVALIMGIIALVQPGKKTFGIIAVVLAIVGAIVSVFVFLSAVGKAVDDAFGGGEVTVSSETAAVDSAETAGGAAEKESSAAAGTRENPAAIGSTITGKDWEVVVNSVVPDATAEVLAANEYNSQPEEGYQYLLVNVTATYTGSGSSSDSMVRIAYVAADGQVYNTYDAFVLAPEPTLGMNELYSGASSTGNEVFAVPVGADGLIRIAPGVLADEVFVQFN